MNLRYHWQVVLVITIAMALSISLPASVMATSVSAKTKKISAVLAPISFQFNNLELAPPPGEEGFMLDGVTYVPLRFMSNAVEQRVKWDPKTYTVFVDPPTRSELVMIRELNLNRVVDEKSYTSATTKIPVRTLTVVQRPITYVFQGVVKSPSDGNSGLLINNKLYVPLRFFGESVGRSINWDAKSYTIAVAPATAVPPASPSTTVSNNVTANSNAAVGNTSSTVPPVSAGSSTATGGSSTAVPPTTPAPATPTPTPPPVSTPPPSKPSYASIITNTNTQIQTLQNKCQSRLTTLANQFFAAKGAKQQMALLAEGEKELAACDAAFENIMNNLQVQLNSNGYGSTSKAVIDDYRKQYDAMKEAEIQRLLSKM